MVDTGEGGVLEEVEGPPSADSFGGACGCFLGMVKVVLLTRSAPEAWWRDPGGPDGDKIGIGGGGGPCFLGLFKNLLLCGGGCFLRSLVLLKGAVLGFPLVGAAASAVPLIPFETGDFFPLLGATFEVGAFFSADVGSFSGFTSSISSFSLSFWTAAGKQRI